MAKDAGLLLKTGRGYPVIWIVTFKRAPSAAELRAKKAKLRKYVKDHVLERTRKELASPGFKIQTKWLRHGKKRNIFYVLVNAYNSRPGDGTGVVAPTPPSPPQPKI